MARPTGSARACDATPRMTGASHQGHPCRASQPGAALEDAEPFLCQSADCPKVRPEGLRAEDQRRERWLGGNPVFARLQIFCSPLEKRGNPGFRVVKKFYNKGYGA